MSKLVHWDEIQNSKVILRLDLNVPIRDNKIYSDFRIIKSIPTIRELLSRNNRIILLSHLGRPAINSDNASLSLEIVANYLSEKLQEKIIFYKNINNDISFTNHRIAMLENVRLFSGEQDNAESFSKKLSQLGDVFVFDAFGVAHRAESSTYGIMNYIDYSAGPLLLSEVRNAINVMQEPRRPLCTIISGAKISTKLTLLKTFIDKADHIILGGGILNTYLHAKDYEIGESICEKRMVDTMRKILNSTNSDKIVPPTDVVCCVNGDLSDYETKEISMIQSDDKILDVGPSSIEEYNKILRTSSTIFWNGPLGYVEHPPFDSGTKSILRVLAKSSSYTMIGGGDTVSLVEKMDLQDSISYLSTGGGALLKFIEGKEMPTLRKLGLME